MPREMNKSNIKSVVAQGNISYSSCQYVRE